MVSVKTLAVPITVQLDTIHSSHVGITVVLHLLNVAWIDKNKNLDSHPDLNMLCPLLLITELELAKFLALLRCISREYYCFQIWGRIKQVAVLTEVRICVGCRWNSSRGCHSKCEWGFGENYGIPTNVAGSQGHLWKPCRACAHNPLCQGCVGSTLST